MRLETILGCVADAEYKVLADIGTDHAFIPIEAIKRKLATRAIACDIAPEPLEIGRKNVIKEGLDEYIELRLGDGLEPIRHGEADVIVIAGMGGLRILGIISKNFNKICGAKLILQPQHDTGKLRRGLFNLGIKICSEHLAGEGERFYEILCASKNSEIPLLSEEDFFVGSHTGELASRFYLQKKQKIEKYIHLISDEKEKEQAYKKLSWLAKFFLDPKS